MAPAAAMPWVDFAAGRFAEAAAAYEALADAVLAALAADACGAPAAPSIAAACLANSAACKLSLGVLRGAVKDADAALALDPTQLRAHAVKSRALLLRGKRKLALDAWRRGMDCTDASSDVGLVRELAECFRDAQEAPPPPTAAATAAVATDVPALAPHVRTEPRDSTAQRPAEPPPPPAEKKAAAAGGAARVAAPLVEKVPPPPAVALTRKPSRQVAAVSAAAVGGRRKPVEAAPKDIPIDVLRAARSELTHRTGDDDVDDAIARGYLLVNTGHLDAALARTRVEEDPDTIRERIVDAHFDRLISRAPDLLAARLGRGSAFAFSGRLEAAISDFDAAVLGHPTCVDALKRRGQSLAALGRHSAALTDLDAAAELMRLGVVDGDVFQQRGVLKQKMGDYRAAASDLRLALSHAEAPAGRAAPQQGRAPGVDAAQSWNYLGLCEAQLGSSAARASFGEAVRYDPQFKEAWLNLGQAHRERGDAKNAEMAFDSALAIDPTFSTGHHAKGVLLYGVGDHVGARSCFLAALNCHADASVVLSSLHHLALCHQVLCDFACAREAYEKLLRLDGEHAGWYNLELCIFAESKLYLPLRLADDDLDPSFKEAHSRKFKPDTVSGCAPSKVAKKKVVVKKRACTRRAKPVGPRETADFRGQWVQAAKPVEAWIQLNCIGFLPNRRQHRAFGLAALTVAQLLRKAWDGSTNISWRSAFEAAACWRRESEPNDAVWWLDRLPPEAFAEGFGLQTPLVSGQLAVVRYHPYLQRALQVVKQQLAATDNAGGGALRNDAAAWRADVAAAETLDDLYKVCGGSDFWVAAPCASGVHPGRSLEGTRVTVQRRKPDGYDVTIRTPGTPERWDLFDAELTLSWAKMDSAASKWRLNLAAGTPIDFGLQKAAVHAALTTFYFWVSFGPLSRGSAACGYAVLAGMLMGLGFAAPLPKMPTGVQLDWEAILRATPQEFCEDASIWLLPHLVVSGNGGASPRTAQGDVVDDLPPFQETFVTLDDLFKALAA